MSFPVADIWENARVKELNLPDSPIEISLKAFKYLIVSSAWILKPSIIFSAPTISVMARGDIFANSLICGISFPATSLPTIVSMAVCMDWNSPRTRMISEPNAFRTPAPPITANAFFHEMAIPLFTSTTCFPSFLYSAYSSRSFFTDSRAFACSWVSPNKASRSLPSALSCSLMWLSSSLSSLPLETIFLYNSLFLRIVVWREPMAFFWAIIFSVKLFTDWEASKIFFLKSPSIATPALAASFTNSFIRWVDAASWVLSVLKAAGDCVPSIPFNSCFNFAISLRSLTTSSQSLPTLKYSFDISLI